MKKYTAKYFEKTKKIMESKKPNSVVMLQFFQNENDAILGGMNETIDFLKKHTNTNNYSIKYLPEGSIIKAKEVVLQLEGQYQEFGLYEGLIDGILARSTSLATNARKIKNITGDKQVIFMGDRADHYSNQERDGLAIALGGIETQVTDAHVSMHAGKAIGTMPHALIQMFGGDLVKALKAYKDVFPEDKITALVDFKNDVLSDSLKAVKEFGKELFAIRIDTSDSISDAMFPNNEEYGVTPNMIKRLKKMLIKNNAEHVKIIVSSGFNEKKIKWFEKEKSPVDIYGVGASLLKVNNTFTADAVKIDGKFIAKFGRKYNNNPKLIDL